MTEPDKEAFEATVQDAIAAAIRAARTAALEEAARAFEPDEDGHDSHSYHFTAEEVAAAIRSLKEQP